MGEEFLVSVLVALILASTAYARPSDLGSFVNSLNEFALRLYSQVSSEGANVVLSPFSLSNAMALVYEGARGETAEEMRATLGFPCKLRCLREGFSRLLNYLKGVKGLKVVNALWVQKGFQLLKCYLDASRTYYRARVSELDFVKEAEASRELINRWVEEETGGKIKGLIPPGGIDELTRLVITNAIYFKEAWLYRFNRSETKEGDFWVRPGEAVKVPFMHLSAELPYFEDDEVKVLELPYGSGNVSMIIFLPKGSLSSFEASLDVRKLSELLRNLKGSKVEVYLPRFKLSDSYPLTKTLKRMGLRKLFSGGADLSGMSIKRGLYVSGVFHKAYVEVNEEGTRAAAATAVVVALLVLPLTFRADKPFMFLIIHKPTGLILFIGKLTNPERRVGSG